MPEPSRWRLINDSARAGAWNMAVDEAVLEAVVSGDSPPTLRFYDWRPPCLSTGYAQKLSDFDIERLAADGVELVRRPSGGRGVLHRNELTYCLCIPEGDWRVGGGLLESYRRISDGFLAGLARLGVSGELAQGHGEDKGAASAACFDSPSRYELTATGRKVIGSAQWRHGGGVLQHGSVPLNGDVADLVDYLALGETDRQRAREVLWRHAATVSQALGRPVAYGQVAEALAAGLAGALAVFWEPAALTATELARAEMLVREKYGTEGWNART
jgi:lipoate-protein ligase A